MNITSILKGIESFALELFIWLIFIPKTLYRIIKDPKSIPDYVSTELEKEKRFENYMSPVLLYLTISVILYASLRYVSYINQDVNFTENVKGPEGLLFLFIPLSFVLVAAIFSKHGFRKEVLTRNLYIQCYYFSILMFSLICWRLVESTHYNMGEGFGQYLSISAFIKAKTELYFANIPFYLFAATFVWLLYVEVWLIRKELRVGKLKALVITVFYIAILISSYVGYDFLKGGTVQNGAGKGEAERGQFYVEDDGDYGIAIYNDSKRFYNEDQTAFRISLKKNNDDSNLKENWNNFNDKKESLDGLHIIPGMTLIDRMKPNSRVNFIGIAGDSLYFTFRLLDSIKEIKTNDINFDIINNSNKSIFYDSVNPGHTDWDLKIKNKELVLSGLIEKSNNYDLLIKSNFRSLYELQIGVKRNKGFYPYNGFEFYTDIENEPFKYVSPPAQNIKLNQIFQGSFMNPSFYFEGKKGDVINVFISPLPWDKNTDVSFDIFHQGKSIHIPRIWFFGHYFYIIYILLFAPIVFLLFRGLMKKPKKDIS